LEGGKAGESRFLSFAVIAKPSGAGLIRGAAIRRRSRLQDFPTNGNTAAAVSGAVRRRNWRRKRL